MCVDYFSLQREIKLSSSHRGFEYTSFDELSGICIPANLLNVVSCYGFVQDKNPTLILTCRSKLVSYCLSKGFLILWQALKTLKNVPLRVKNHIHYNNTFYGDSIMNCGTEITSVSNILKNIFIIGPL